MGRLYISFLVILTTGLFSFACSGGGGESSSSNDDSDGSDTDDTCFDCEGSQASFLHLDTEGIAALLNVDSNSTGSSSALIKHQTEEGSDTTASPIQGVDEATGEIRDALRCFDEESDTSFEGEGTDGLTADCWDQVPRIVTIAQCNDIIYLVFERSFIVRTETPDGQSLSDYSDPWSASSPFTSQLLRSTVPIGEYAAGDRVERANLEGVLYSLEVNTWDSRRNIQFDDSCNLYLTAHVPGTSDDVLVRIAPNAEEDVYEEIINANICYERYLVTDGGDVHYTGRTASGSDCSGDSFYRVVDSSGVLYEIARDWWDYEFEPLDDGTVVFYGPDPTADGTPSWDSACIFEFDGTESGDDRYTKLVNCINDWPRYVSDGTSAEFTTTSNDTERERCAEQFSTYRGSNAPDKILSIDRNGDGTKEICTIADVEQKKAGTWKCNICIDDSTGHCENSAGMITGDATQGACQATTGNTWGTTGECYNDVTTSACTITQPAGWSMNHDWCQDPGSNWSATYSALSCIRTDKSVELISSTGETVTSAWVTGDRIIYSSVENGEYTMKGVSFGADGTASVAALVEGIEMYEVALDPVNDTDRILVNGLRFSDNSYVFGSYDFDAESLSLNTSLTGVVDTMLILGN